MRAVSDFLDRVVLRTLGDASMLSPRLPSLFEPTGHGAAAVTEAPLQVPATVPGVHAYVPTAPEGRASQGRAATPVSDAPMEPPPPRETAQATMPGERVVVATEALAASPPPPRAAERVPLNTVTSAVPMTTGELQPLRRTTRVQHPPGSTPPTPEPPLGELLPPGQPVFATRQEGPASPPVPAARRSNGPPVDSSRAPSEPVVHVSIGRLEVRAAPSHASAPRPSPAPRPSALDEYLRQRDRPTR